MPNKDRYPLLGKLAVKYRTITEAQLRQALEIMENQALPADLGEILITENMAAPSQVKLLISIKDLLEQREADESFARIALYMGFTTQETVTRALAEQARQFRERKLSRLVSDILVESGDLTPKQRDEVLSEQNRISPLLNREPDGVEEIDLPPMDKAFLSTRRESEKFGNIAVDRRFTTRDKVDLALAAQLAEYKRSRKNRMLGDILVEKGYITPEQKEIVLKVQSSSGTARPAGDPPPAQGAPAPPVKPATGIAVIAARDGMKAHVQISGPLSPPPSPAAIGKLLKEKGIICGIKPDTLIAAALERVGKGGISILVAEGIPATGAEEGAVTFHFENAHDGKIGDTAPIRKGALLAVVSGAREGKPGMDIFGNELPEPRTFPRRIRCGTGSVATEDGSRIFAGVDGHPFMSVDGRIFVFSNLRIAGDTRNGDRFLGFKLNLHAAGTIAHNCIIRGGEVSAAEIRGADLDVLGNIRATVGITGATIRTQGSITAGYIRNSVIEALGDVKVTNEIMDSTIRSGGICRVAQSKVIASDISAKKGISIVTAGTPVSDPCSLTAGTDDHLTAFIRRLDREMGLSTEDIHSLFLEQETVEEGLASVNGRINHLFDYCNRLSRAIKTTSAKLSETPEGQSSPGGSELLGELSVKNREAKANLRELSDEKNGLVKDHEAVSARISEIENVVRELCLVKKGLLSRFGNETGVPKITITGPVSAGTTLAGPHASLTLTDDYPNLKALAAPIEGSDPHEWEIRIKSRDNKYI